MVLHVIPLKRNAAQQWQLILIGERVSVTQISHVEEYLPYAVWLCITVPCQEPHTRKPLSKS